VCQRVEAYSLVVVGENGHDFLWPVSFITELVYRDGVDNLLPNLVNANAMGGSEQGRTWHRSATWEVQRQQGVDLGGVRRREAGHLDGGEVAAVLASHAHIAVA
jgi:hypothetical protein